MGYMHIENLYRNQEILMFKRCYAMEKIHGTSAHISRQVDETGNLKEVAFFAGGEKHENFIKLFNKEQLELKFKELFPNTGIVIFGEAYGGRCQGMRLTYGDALKFVAFDVKVGVSWLNVPDAKQVCDQMGLEFVHYEETDTNIDLLDRLANSDSVQAVRNGIKEPKLREGVVLRPLIELRKNNNERIIAKHKNDKFSERQRQPKVSSDKLEVMTKAKEITDEWVTEMRLSHILDSFCDTDITKTGDIIKAMVEDVLREAKGEVVESDLLKKLIGNKTAAMFHRRLKDSIK